MKLDIQGGRSTFTLEKQEFPFCPIDYEVSIVARNSFFNSREGDQAFLAKCLQMDETGVQALADHVTENPGIFLKGAEWSETEDDKNGGHGNALRYLYCVLPNGHKRPLRLLSSSETGAVLVDLAIARARILAMNRPTLLIIEAGSFSMSEEFLSLFLNELSSPRTTFQSIVVSTELEDDAIWGGWQVIRLSRARGGGFGEQLTEIVIGDMHGVAKAE